MNRYFLLFAQFSRQFKNGKQVMRFVQEEEIQPLWKGHFPKGGMYAGFVEIRFAEAQDLGRHFLAERQEVLHDFATSQAAVVEEQRIGFRAVALKCRVVFLENSAYPPHPGVLGCLQVNDVFKNRPFAGNNLPADLFIRQTVNNVQQGFVLVL